MSKAFQDRTGLTRPAGITGNRDIIVVPDILKWAAEGKLFSAGVGYENAGIDSANSSLEDTTPTFALMSSSAPDIYVLPILLRLSTHTEGGFIPIIHTMITRAAKDCATTLKVSGTAFTAIQNHNSTINSNPSAKAIDTCTSSALTNADYVMLIKAIAADNPITGTGGLGFGRQVTFELDLLSDPNLLQSGAGMLVYCNTQTTDTKYCPYIIWAELTIDDLL